MLILGDKEEEFKGKEESFFNEVSHLGLTLINVITTLGGWIGMGVQVGTNIYIGGIPGSLPLPCSISGISA